MGQENKEQKIIQTFQMKGRDCQTGQKIKTKVYITYKKGILNIKTQVGYSKR